MTISVKNIRDLLGQQPTEDTAKILKEWRAQERLSQTEAAIRLGVPVRTLEGWELGRPMSYPRLLQNIAARRDRFSLVQSEFPREFAAFIDFVGGKELDTALRKVDQKLNSTSPIARTLYGDRYFFHEQFIRFTYGTPPFQLDVSDLVAVRAASLIAGINRVKQSLSSTGVVELRSRIIGYLRPDQDIRQLEHEIRCSTHFGRKGFEVTFADFNNVGNFDLLIGTPSGAIDVACKTVTEDTGSQIKSDLNVDMSETFRKSIAEKLPIDESGLFIFSLKRPVAQCKNFSHQLKSALQSERPQFVDATDFTLTFLPRPKWQELLDAERGLDLRQHIVLDPEFGNHARCATRVGNRIVALTLRPHKPTALVERIVAVIKEGADQCSGERASIVWLHFVGLAEAEFQSLAEFSMAGSGAGLNTIVANALHPSASTTDRAHVHTVRFSSDSSGLSRHPALRPDLLIEQAVSSGGMIYDVPNPPCRFQMFADV